MVTSSHSLLHVLWVVNERVALSLGEKCLLYKRGGHKSNGHSEAAAVGAMESYVMRKG